AASKGVLYTLRALQIVRNEFPNVLLLINDSLAPEHAADESQSYKQQVLGEIEKHNLHANVLCAPLGGNELPAAFSSAALSMYTSIREEPFALPPVQAMACGRPVVISRSGGLIEEIIDGKTGFIINKRDEKAL